MTHAATLRLNEGTSIALDAIRRTKDTRPGVLVSFEGRVPGQVLNCAMVPLHMLPELLQLLQLVGDAVQAEG